MFYVYMLISEKNGEMYIGSTKNLARRVQEHNSGVEISTKRYMPWKLFYYEAYSSEALARNREMRLKQHGNAKKELKRRVGFKSGAGFTVTELIVAMGVFVVVVVIAVGVFVGVVQNQRRLTELMAVNNNAGAALEQMTREIRTGYRFCEGQNPAQPCDATTESLNFENYAGDAVRYARTEGNRIVRSVEGGAEIGLTSSEVDVTDLAFIVAQRGLTLGSDLCAPWRITILMRARPRGDADASRETKLQTTVSSRVFPVEAPGAPDSILQTCQR